MNNLLANTKKIIALAFVVIGMAIALNVQAPSTVYAEPSLQDKTVCGSGGSFFGLPTWYKYLDMNPEGSVDSKGHDIGCTVKNFSLLGSDTAPSSLPLILLALIDIALRIGAIVAVAFVVIGGIKFVTSQGEPDEVKGARNTILNALIGLALTVIATPIVVFIGNRFGG